MEEATTEAQKLLTIASLNTAEQLQKLSMEQMMRLEDKTAEEFGCFVYDNAVFKKIPLDVIAASETPDVPLIVGSNLDEIRYWTAMDALPVVQKTNKALEKQLWPLAGAGTPQLLETYMKDCPTYYDAMVTLAGDISFRIPSIRLAEVNSKRKPTFMYLLMYRSGTRGQTGLEYGSAHSMELPFVFGVEYPDVLVVTGPKKEWGNLMEEMTSAWTNFARSGDPNGASVPPWPRYDDEKRSTMEFAAQHSKVVDDPFSAERLAWTDVPTKKIFDALGLFEKLLPAEN
jgi:para-nitrobenzyl esterase